MSITIEDPLSVKRLLGLALLSVALILSISQLTNRRIEVRKPELAVELRSLETKVEASSIQEVIPALVPEKPQEAPQAPKPVELAVTPPEPQKPVVEPPKPVEQPKPAPKPVPKPITGDKQAWLSASIIPQSEWDKVDWLVQKESSWRPNAQNPRSTAFGLKQFLDSTWKGVGCTKAEAIGNPVYQLNCGHKYVINRYKSWDGAVAFWKAHRWY